MRAFMVFIIFFLAMMLFVSTSLQYVDLTPNSAEVVQAAAAPPPSAPAAAEPVTIIQQSPVLPTAAVAFVPVTGACANPYIVQPGDWLLKIGRNCTTTLAVILQANPQISNPDLIYPDQLVNLPNAGAYVPIPVSGYQPAMRAGSPLQVHVVDLPPNTPVLIAIGPRDVGYTVLAEGLSDASGSLTTYITLPNAADASTPWVVVVATTTLPPIQIVSPTFYIY